VPGSSVGSESQISALPFEIWDLRCRRAVCSPLDRYIPCFFVEVCHELTSPTENQNGVRLQALIGRVCHSRMFLAGIQAEFGLDPRLKHSGVTILASRISSPQPQFSKESFMILRSPENEDGSRSPHHTPISFHLDGEKAGIGVRNKTITLPFSFPLEGKEKARCCRPDSFSRVSQPRSHNRFRTSISNRVRL
jgi:hypothetical protein